MTVPTWRGGCKWTGSRLGVYFMWRDLPMMDSQRWERAWSHSVTWIWISQRTCPPVHTVLSLKDCVKLLLSGFCCSFWVSYSIVTSAGLSVSFFNVHWFKTGACTIGQPLLLPGSWVEPQPQWQKCLGEWARESPYPRDRSPEESIPVLTWHPMLKASASVFSPACEETSVLAVIIFLGRCAGVDRVMTDPVIPHFITEYHISKHTARKDVFFPFFCPGLFCGMSLLYWVWLCTVYCVWRITWN